MDAQKPICWAVLLGVFAGGCDPAPAVSEPEPAAPPCQTGTLFDPQASGTISGRVAWMGDLPDVPPYRVLPVASFSAELTQLARRANPNAPLIDPGSRGVGSAVVFLRRVEPQRGRPWDLPSVDVQLQGMRIEVLQGGPARRYGIVRCGDEVHMVSRQPLLHALHADGAAFFTLPFPDPDQPLVRRFRAPGLVELSSGAGYYWMRAYLFVTEHPYYCCTDAAGAFALAAVPAGEYELVCWMPSWIEERRHRDPDNFQPTRVYYRPPVEIVRKLTVRARETAAVDFEVSVRAFAPGGD
jgi:hypothetical protein